LDIGRDFNAASGCGASMELMKSLGSALTMEENKVIYGRRELHRPVPPAENHGIL
jgi:hypothetical protein